MQDQRAQEIKALKLRQEKILDKIAARIALRENCEDLRSELSDVTFLLSLLAEK